MHRIVGLVLAAVLIPVSLAAAPADLEGRRKALNDLLGAQWEYSLRTSPIFASILGDKRWNDKIDDFSQASIDGDLAESKKFLTRFEAIDGDLAESKRFLARFEVIDTAGFPEQEALNKRLMVRDLRMKLEGERFKTWEMPVSQNNGPQVDLPQLVSLLSFQNVKDFEDYIARLRAMPRYFDENIVQMRKGMAEGLMQPRFCWIK